MGKGYSRVVWAILNVGTISLRRFLCLLCFLSLSHLPFPPFTFGLYLVVQISLICYVTWLWFLKAERMEIPFGHHLEKHSPWDRQLEHYLRKYLEPHSEARITPFYRWENWIGVIELVRGRRKIQTQVYLTLGYTALGSWGCLYVRLCYICSKLFTGSPLLSKNEPNHGNGTVRPHMVCHFLPLTLWSNILPCLLTFLHFYIGLFVIPYTNQACSHLWAFALAFPSVWNTLTHKYLLCNDPTSFKSVLKSSPSYLGLCW